MPQLEIRILLSPIFFYQFRRNKIKTSMGPEEKRKWMQMNTDDFNRMREMLSEIERKIMHFDPVRQREFYQPLLNIIFMAWEDACNNEDPFLTQPPSTNK